MQKLKGVIIGCGAIAREHLAALAELNNVEVAAVCDLSAARVVSTCERFGIAKSYADYKQMLTDIRPDIVHVTTPPGTHFSIAKHCLERGLNVLCEKPIALTHADFLILKDLAQKNGLLLMESQNLRYHSSTQKILALIESGAVGDILDAEVRFSLSLLEKGSAYADRNLPHYGLNLPGGVIGDFLPHIGYLAYMFAGRPKSLRTVWTKYTADSPLPYDEFRGLIKGERATAYVSFNGNSRLSGFWLRIIGTEMVVETDLLEPPRLMQRRFRAGEQALMTMINGIAEARAIFSGSVRGLWRKLGGTSNYDGMRASIAACYQAIETRGPQPVPLQELDEISQLVQDFADPEYML